MMKNCLPILLLIITKFTYAQICTISDTDFIPYLIPFYGPDIIVSLDSIKCNGNLKFESKEKDLEYNITHANLADYSGSIMMPVLDSIEVKYNGNHITEYLRYHRFNDGIDTAEFFIYDAQNRLVYKQERDHLWCGTGAPPDESRTLYLYDENGELIREKIDIKWNYNSQSRPFNQWVQYKQTDYIFNEGNKASEYSQFNYFEEDMDTVFLELYPFAEINYTYENDQLIEVLHEKWDFEIERWLNVLLEKYSYFLDTVFYENFHWNTNSSAWEKYSRNILTKENGLNQKLNQIYESSTGDWVNNSWEYYEFSNVADNLDYYKYYWKQQEHEWEMRESIEFDMAGDTIQEYRKYLWSADRLYQYLFNDYGLLILRKDFKYDQIEEKWDLEKELRNEYSDYDLPLIKSDIRYHYYTSSDTVVSLKEYFWDEMVKTEEIAELKSIKIFPNPVRDKLGLLWGETWNELSVYDVNGNRVKSLKRANLSVVDLVPGLYFVKVPSRNGDVFVGKFVKI